jgi:hypothetical protein
LEGEAPPPINRERLFTNPIERFWAWNLWFYEK